MSKPNPFDWYWQADMQSQTPVSEDKNDAHSANKSADSPNDDKSTLAVNDSSSHGSSIHSASSNSASSNSASSNSASSTAASAASATMELAQGMTGGGLTGGLVKIITQVMVKPDVIKAKDMAVCQQVKQKHSSNHQQMQNKIKQLKS